MDISDLSGLGAQILTLGTELKQKRAAHEAIGKEIAELEKELAPLVVQHASIIAEFVGKPVHVGPPNAPPNAPVGGAMPLPSASPSMTSEDLMIRKKVVSFLEEAEPGVSAYDVAEALQLPLQKVRSVMMAFAQRG